MKDDSDRESCVQQVQQQLPGLAAPLLTAFAPVPGGSLCTI
jgi:hypothetical protein